MRGFTSNRDPRPEEAMTVCAIARSARRTDFRYEGTLDRYAGEA